MFTRKLAGIAAAGAMAFALGCGSTAKEKPMRAVEEEAEEIVTKAIEIVEEEINADLPMSPPREFRSVWVATVANIDWPTKPGLSTEEQQAEAIAILDKVQEMNMNSVVFQVRPQCDAFYQSDLEPWSYFLTGEQGKAPEPFYDPLEFWVEEAHDRGIELHVWFNPYRAHHTATKSDLAASHPMVKNPEMGYTLANGMKWLDPAREDVQDHSLAVMLDVVKRYDIDGAHMDDYFYPYSSYNEGADFPDDPTWEAYKASGGDMSRADWRRHAVDNFVERLYEGIKAEKKHVKFGLSPFGIWRPGHPRSIRGLDQYNALYADAKLWLNKGWVDYYTPQLYWEINKIPQSFPVLLGWWKEQNWENRHLWPGMGTHKVAGDNDTTVDEIFNQIMVTRGIVSEAPGHVHFSMKHLQNNPSGLSDTLKEGPYAEQALVPASPWLDDEAPAAPAVSYTKSGNGVEISWEPADAGDAFLYVVYTKTGENWDYEIVTRNVRSHTAGADVSKIVVTSVDRVGNESEKVAQEVN